MSAVLVREATLADTRAMGQIHVAAWRAAYAGIMGASFLARMDPREREGLWRGLISGGTRVLVAFEGEFLRGFACYGAERDDSDRSDVGELMAINLHPDAWRHGFGSALLVAVVERLRAGGFREAVLWVVRENVRARAFYEAREWRGDGGEKHDAGARGSVVHEVRYRRAL